MSVDPVTGMYREEIYHTPGPGNNAGLGTALDILNVMKAQRLNDQLEAEKTQKELEFAQSQAGESSLLNTPEGKFAAQQFGVSPETVSGINQNAPTVRVQNRVRQAAEAAGPEGLKPEQVAQIYMEETGSVPPSLSSLLGRQTSNIGAGQRQNKKTLGQVYQEMLKQSDTDKEARRKAADAYVAVEPNLSVTEQAGLEDWVSHGTDEPTPYAKARTGTQIARGKEAGAKAGLETARAKQIETLTPAELKLLEARAVESGAHAGFYAAAAAAEARSEDWRPEALRTVVAREGHHGSFRSQGQDHPERDCQHHAGSEGGGQGHDRHSRRFDCRLEGATRCGFYGSSRRAGG